MPKPKHAMVIVLDRLGAGFLGPYGNTWLDTPQLNRLAAQSLTFDTALIDSPRIDLLYRSYWQGLHAAHAGKAADSPSLPERLDSQGVESALISDATPIGELLMASHFSETVKVATAPAAKAAVEIGQTQIARLCAETIDYLQSRSLPGLLWVHADAMSGPWDAPSALRDQFADEDDPLPPDFVQPPALEISPDFDPDELLGITHAYAGQVALTDVCLGALLDAVDSLYRDRDLLLVLTSARGYPLGEHHIIGPVRDALYGELLHVPFMVRLPEGQFAAQRSAAIVQPVDLFATLLDWFAPEDQPTARHGKSLLSLARGETVAGDDRALSIHAEQLSIRTRAWFLQSDGESNRLYAKPDDRWEVNEIADRCQDIVVELEAAVHDFTLAVQGDEEPDLHPLSEILVAGID